MQKNSKYHTGLDNFLTNDDLIQYFQHLIQKPLFQKLFQRF